MPQKIGATIFCKKSFFQIWAIARSKNAAPYSKIPMIMNALVVYNFSVNIKVIYSHLMKKPRGIFVWSCSGMGGGAPFDPDKKMLLTWNLAQSYFVMLQKKLVANSPLFTCDKNWSYDIFVCILKSNSSNTIIKETGLSKTPSKSSTLSCFIQKEPLFFFL